MNEDKKSTEPMEIAFFQCNGGKPSEEQLNILAQAYMGNDARLRKLLKTIDKALETFEVETFYAAEIRRRG